MRTLALRLGVALTVLAVAGPFLPAQPPRPQILDGTSNTILLSEGLDGSRLGARFLPMSSTLFRQLKLEKDQGLIVQEVTKDGPAAKAGLAADDILLELGGKPVAGTVGELDKVLDALGKGKTVEAVVLRDGKRQTLKGLVLAEEKDDWLNRRLFLTPDVRAWEYRHLNSLLPFIEKENLYQVPGNDRPGWKVWNRGDPLMTTTHGKDDRFTTRQQEGSLVLTVHGTVKDGKVQVAGIRVQDGANEKTYKSADKVPDEYRDKVNELIDLSGKR